MPSHTHPDAARPLLFPPDARPVSEELVAVNTRYLAQEAPCVEGLTQEAGLDAAATARVSARARGLVQQVRANRVKSGGIDAFMHQYDLSSQEGIVLMCLAESLLRVPDADTADKLIRDKLASGDWKGHLGGSQSLFVNASTWGLMLTGRIMGPDPDAVDDPTGFMSRMVSRAGEPVVRTAMRQAMKIMGHQFVMGRTIEEARKRSLQRDNRIYRYSFDMLGEAALTAQDAERYLASYAEAIGTIGESGSGTGPGSVFSAPSISVKLSALHPRYEFFQRERSIDDLVPRLTMLAEKAAALGIGLTVDAEETERLELSLELFEAVYRSRTLDGWEGLGLAIQAYQKRAVDVVDWVVALSRRVGRRIPARLVKGAYWDTEIKRSQEAGLVDYPVFTRKQYTDVSYLACARRLLAAPDAVYPQFATHNAHTLASIVEMVGGSRSLEFQRLHGMGEELYREVVGEDKLGYACRVYAPVGRHEDLLPYLVRRLLENGANTSFVNRIVDEKAPIEEIIADPVAASRALAGLPHPRIPTPTALYGDARKNSRGLNVFDRRELIDLAAQMNEALSRSWRAAPVVNGVTMDGNDSTSVNPADTREVVGTVRSANAEAVGSAIDAALAARRDWSNGGAQFRAACLERAADLFEEHSGALMALCVREAGKTVPDSHAEVREAIDFLRYYAMNCRRDFAEPVTLPGPTGESNQLMLSGRGVFVCISPWNFPLAIFTGQVAAALAAGNTVLAKPAEQTPLVADEAVRLLYQAGVPKGVLHFLPGDGHTVGAAAVADPRIAGVAFTGSTETARIINRTLAARDGSLATLIAETGGQNAMVVDSSALPEQVVIDAVHSAFGSAGQRCSALRVLYVQDEIAPRILDLLGGYLAEMRIGDPAQLHTDLGPVIDEEARTILNAHVEKFSDRIIHRLPVPQNLSNGQFFGPVVIGIDSLDELEREVFGPVLHVIRYKAADIDKVIDAINASGYGLTLGLHSRIDSSARYVRRRIDVGNVYVNRNMIGAVVGVQPFGGCGLSGTGPKAGGPHYLHRFATEKTVTINTAAVGGNTSLLTLT